MERAARKLVFVISGTGNQQKALVIPQLVGKNGLYRQLTARFADTYNGTAAGGATLTLAMYVEDQVDSGARSTLLPAYAEASTTPSEFLVSSATGITAAASATLRAGADFLAQPIAFEKGLAVKVATTSATGAWTIVLSLTVEIDL